MDKDKCIGPKQGFITGLLDTFTIKLFGNANDISDIVNDLGPTNIFNISSNQKNIPAVQRKHVNDNEAKLPVKKKLKMTEEILPHRVVLVVPKDSTKLITHSVNNINNDNTDTHKIVSIHNCTSNITNNKNNIAKNVRNIINDTIHIQHKTQTINLMSSNIQSVARIPIKNEEKVITQRLYPKLSTYSFHGNISNNSNVQHKNFDDNRKLSAVCNKPSTTTTNVISQMVNIKNDNMVNNSLKTNFNLFDEGDLDKYEQVHDISDFILTTNSETMDMNTMELKNSCRMNNSINLCENVEDTQTLCDLLPLAIQNSSNNILNNRAENTTPESGNISKEIKTSINKSKNSTIHKNKNSRGKSLRKRAKKRVRLTFRKGESKKRTRAIQNLVMEVKKQKELINNTNDINKDPNTSASITNDAESQFSIVNVNSTKNCNSTLDSVCQSSDGVVDPLHIQTSEPVESKNLTNTNGIKCREIKTKVKISLAPRTPVKTQTHVARPNSPIIITYNPNLATNIRGTLKSISSKKINCIINESTTSNSNDRYSLSVSNVYKPTDSNTKLVVKEISRSQQNSGDLCITNQESSNCLKNLISNHSRFDQSPEKAESQMQLSHSHLNTTRQINLNESPTLKGLSVGSNRRLQEIQVSGLTLKPVDPKLLTNLVLKEKLETFYQSVSSWKNSQVNTLSGTNDKTPNSAALSEMSESLVSTTTAESDLMDKQTKDCQLCDRFRLEANKMWKMVAQLRSRLSNSNTNSDHNVKKSKNNEEGSHVSFALMKELEETNRKLLDALRMEKTQNSKLRLNLMNRDKYIEELESKLKNVNKIMEETEVTQLK